MISPDDFVADKAFPGMAELPRFQQVCWFDAGPPAEVSDWLFWLFLV